MLHAGASKLRCSDNLFLFRFEICRCLKKHRHFCYLFAVGMDGLCCLFLPVLQNFPLLVPFSFTFGYFDGAYVTLIPVVTADIVGTSSLSSALGVVYFLHAIPYLVSPPVAGQFTNYFPVILSLLQIYLLVWCRRRERTANAHWMWR